MAYATYAVPTSRKGPLMTVRLTLLCTAASTDRDVRFGADAPLDARALREARTAADTLPASGTRYTGPSQRCRQTAQALGWDTATVEPALRDLDLGSWQGRTLDEIATADGPGLAVWMSDPAAAPHGGESVADACHRIATWLDSLPTDTGRVQAVVEQSVARAALLHTLGAPHQSFWRIDVPPLSAVHLTSRAGRWNLRTGTA